LNPQLLWIPRSNFVTVLRMCECECECECDLFALNSH